MSRRSRAREVALQALHQLEFNDEAPSGGEPAASGSEPAAVVGGPLGRALRGFLKGRLRSGPLVDFAEELVTGVRGARVELDRLLDERSTHWRVSRMAATDRTVLRIALYELMHTATPGPVVVDEAIELARRYGSAQSPRFVAGILGSLVARPPTAPANT
jgi:N utilization substance protein B